MIRASAAPLLALFALAACAPAISPGALRPTPKPPPAATPARACYLVGESIERRQLVGISDLSFDVWRQAIVTVLVKRPDGWVAIDPAFGAAIEEDLRRSPTWFKAVMGSARTKRPLLDLLKEAGVDPREIRYALITHAHWDHAGALIDLPRARVLLHGPERAFVAGLRRYLEHGTMRHHFDLRPRRVEGFALDGPPYETFAHSKDLFGDGSIVAVPLPGHTPGSVGYFLAGANGKKHLLIGDTAWSMEGVKRPAHKMALARGIVDSDVDVLSETLGHLHALYKAREDIVIVPAHDLGQMETLPPCTKEWVAKVAGATGG